MSSRSKMVIETPESKAIKQLRQKRELSLQDVADRLSVSKQLVHLIESGRANIGKEYLQRFLEKLDYTRMDLEAITTQYRPPKGPNLRQLCHDKLDKIEDSKLEKIFDYMSKF